MKLKNRIALVAGATRGVGLAITRRLAASGTRLIIPWHDDWPDDYRLLHDELGEAELSHIFVEADLRKPGDVERVAATVRRKAGILHILINNIERGGMPIVHGSYEREINRDEWQLELDTTLLAKRLLFEACLPLLKKASQASVVNISSIAGITGRGGPAGLVYSDGYAAANRGVSSFTETWARMGAPTVRVNELMLGIIDTRHGKKTRGWQALSPGQRKKILNHTLAGRTGTPEEVAETLLFMIRDATYMTGCTVRLDGGFVLGGEQVPSMPDGII